LFAPGQVHFQCAEQEDHRDRGDPADNQVFFIEIWNFRVEHPIDHRSQVTHEQNEEAVEHDSKGSFSIWDG
jgi:hypothetical protein